MTNQKPEISKAAILAVAINSGDLMIQEIDFNYPRFAISLSDDSSEITVTREEALAEQQRMDAGNTVTDEMVRVALDSYYGNEGLVSEIMFRYMREALEERLIPLVVTDEMLDAYESAVPSNGTHPDSVVSKAIRMQRKTGLEAALRVMRARR